MATAAAYGHALGIPVYGVCSLDAIGVDTSGDVLVVTDARRREVYWARYRDGVRVDGPAVNAPGRRARRRRRGRRVTRARGAVRPAAAGAGLSDTASGWCAPSTGRAARAVGAAVSAPAGRQAAGRASGARR